jgi:hypothetical protein
MRTQTLLDESAPTPSCPQRQALEPSHIVVVEEHVTHGYHALVDLVRVTGQDDTFGDNAVHGGWEGGACTDEAKRGFCVIRGSSALEVEERHVAPGQWANEGGDGILARVQEAVEFMDIVGGVACLGEEL